ncbi:MAG: DUF1902 domain-containing protein [Methylomicrobium sp.]|nr:DUF1902 domain-containing protein [Methylomicrobium sp.]
MKYPLSYPLARWLGRLGVTLTVAIDVTYDKEAHVYVATSPDIDGLVLETDSFKSLIEEVEEAVVNLLTLNKKSTPSKTQADLIFRDHIVIA